MCVCVCFRVSVCLCVCICAHVSVLVINLTRTPLRSHARVVDIAYIKISGVIRYLTVTIELMNVQTAVK